MANHRQGSGIVCRRRFSNGSLMTTGYSLQSSSQSLQCNWLLLLLSNFLPLSCRDCFSLAALTPPVLPPPPPLPRHPLHKVNRNSTNNALFLRPLPLGESFRGCFARPVLRLRARDRTRSQRTPSEWTDRPGLGRTHAFLLSERAATRATRMKMATGLSIKFASLFFLVDEKKSFPLAELADS